MTIEPSAEAREAFGAFELAGWRRAATRYDTAFTRLTVQAAPHLIELAGVGPGTRLLDVACGPGELAGLAVRSGARVVAVDFSPEMVAIATARQPGAEVRIADAQALPFEAATFDVVTMSFLLGHLSDPERALAEAHRVLVPGGRIALSWWTPPEQSVAFGIVFQAIESRGSTDVGLPQALPFNHFRDPDMIGAILAGAGFRDAHSRLIEMTWSVTSGDEVFEAYLHGSVRTGGLLQRQTPEALEAIRQAIVERIREFKRGERIELPMPAYIVAARKP